MALNVTVDPTEGEGAHSAYSLEVQSICFRYRAGQAVPALMTVQAESFFNNHMLATL